MSEDFKCPCEEVDPDHFISNEELEYLLMHPEIKFKQEDYLRIFNCIHCNDCNTAEERFFLKQRFLRDGNDVPGLDNHVQALLAHGTPFTKNESRVKIPDEIPDTSDTLLYLGCFTAVKTPRYAENVIKYLLAQQVDFCLQEKEICCGYPILCTGDFETYDFMISQNKDKIKDEGYKQIITVCPSCYMVFKRHYGGQNLEIKYFTEFLRPAKQRREGNLIIQHACPLKNGAIPGIVEFTENVYRESGYTILEIVPNRCCGGGVGHQLRTDISEAIALRRMDDFLDSELLKQVKGKNNYITTYCPDAHWILKVYGRKKKIPFKLKDMCELLL